jgi:hypothetical protein
MATVTLTDFLAKNQEVPIPKDKGHTTWSDNGRNMHRIRMLKYNMQNAV